MDGNTKHSNFFVITIIVVARNTNKKSKQEHVNKNCNQIYEKMIQHIFRSMFDFGNAILHNNTIEQIKEQDNNNLFYQRPTVILEKLCPRWPLNS